MPGIAGIEIKAAIKKTATWGTALACGANDGILILPTSIKKDMGIDVDDSLGFFWSKDGSLGSIKVEGALPAYLRYDGLDLPIALFMGIAGAPTLHAAGAISYDYTYKWDTDTDGLFAVFAKHMKNYIEEHSSIKITGMTIKGEIGKPIQISFDTISINRIHNSAVNTTGTFANVTFSETANRVRFAESKFRINSQSGIALADGDKIYPSSFELTAKRKLTGVYDGQYKTTGVVQDLICEPENDGVPEISLKLTFPRHTSTTYLAALLADTRQKMDITFTGGIIEGAIARSMLFQFPHLQIKNDDIADAQGIIQEPVEFVVHGAAAAPTGMTGIIEPFWISGTNKRSTNPLA